MKILSDARQNNWRHLTFRNFRNRKIFPGSGAKENIRFAGLDRTLICIPCRSKIILLILFPSMIITNPPYGGRITDEDCFHCTKISVTLSRKNIPDAQPGY